MIHQCKVHCHTMDAKTAEDLGIEDPGKWLPFMFSMDSINMAKLSSDEEGSVTYNCTTVFTIQGDTFIIDTPYEEFFKKFSEYNTLQFVFKELPPPENNEEGGDDLDL